MLEKLQHARDCDGEEIDGEPCEHLNDEEWHDEDGAERAIDEDPLSLQVQGDWHADRRRGSRHRTASLKSCSPLADLRRGSWAS